VASRKEARSTVTSDFYVGPWLAHSARNLICDRAITRHLEPQVMDLLVFLSNTGGRVVSKEELIDAVWDGRFIADTTLTRAVADLRRALGDDQRSPQYIETIPKRGYRFVAAVSANGGHPEATATKIASAIETHASQFPCARIADRLASERRRRFVGRENEIAVFRSALLADEPPFVVLHVNGPGGVGKTTLLEEFVRMAQEAGRVVVRIDGRNIEASSLGFLVALSGALGVDCELSAVIEGWPVGAVLLVDTYELLTSLDGWLRDTLLPQLPARSLVVIAGR
jgi:DNA-binding winged helix-turn-helix (wHTH) protein